MLERVRSASPAVLWSVGVTLGTLVFGGLQNEGHLVGGDISLPKTLWLNLTILCFLVLPAVWWRDQRLDPHMRILFGVIFVSFVVRAAVELPMLYLTDGWRCSYGIAHDLVTATVAVSLFVRARTEGTRSVLHSSGLLSLIVALLFVEAGFAYAFCSVADPASGTYFAGDQAAFRAINRATWVAVAIGYPILAVVLWGAARPAQRAKTVPR